MAWHPNKDQAVEVLHEAYDLQMKGKIDEAIPLYQKSIDLCPTAEAHNYLGWAYSMKGKFDEAIEECKKAIEIDPDFGNPYNDIGAYLIDKGQFDEALPWLEKATQASKYENYCYAFYNLGRVYEHKKIWGKSLENYQNSLRANPEYTLAAKAVARVRAFLS